MVLANPTQTTMTYDSHCHGINYKGWPEICIMYKTCTHDIVGRDFVRYTVIYSVNIQIYIRRVYTILLAGILSDIR